MPKWWSSEGRNQQQQQAHLERQRAANKARDKAAKQKHDEVKNQGHTNSSKGREEGNRNK
jgi:hypothetical protein